MTPAFWFVAYIAGALVTAFACGLREPDPSPGLLPDGYFYGWAIVLWPVVLVALPAVGLFFAARAIRGRVVRARIAARIAATLRRRDALTAARTGQKVSS